MDDKPMITNAARHQKISGTGGLEKQDVFEKDGKLRHDSKMEDRKDQAQKGKSNGKKSENDINAKHVSKRSPKDVNNQVLQVD